MFRSLFLILFLVIPQFAIAQDTPPNQTVCPATHYVCGVGICCPNP